MASKTVSKGYAVEQILEGDVGEVGWAAGMRN